MEFGKVLVLVLVQCVLFGAVMAGKHQSSGQNDELEIMKQVAITGGKAGASNTHSNACWKPINAFIAQHGCGWHNGEHHRGFPVLLWYDFNREVIPVEVSFQPRGDRNRAGITQTPTRYQIIGSNDEYCLATAAWSVICEDLSGRNTRNVYDTRYCRMKDESHKSYRCLGIRMLGNNDVHGWVSLSNVRVMEKV